MHTSGSLRDARAAGDVIIISAETMARYAKAGVLNDIEDEKKAVSLASGEKNAQMLGVTKPEEAFTKPASIVECASWDITGNGNGIEAVCRGCKLVAMCKKLETPSPLAVCTV